jgi:hypothetical protein
MAELLKDDQRGEEGVKLKEMISKKGMTKIRKRVAKLKEDNH